ncbi:putative ribonuclease H-like domain-containing protein, partial [Tanacetum coccineum]
FDGKGDEGFFVGYTVNSKAFRVFNSRTRIVEENLHITFLENKPNVAGNGLTWLFDIDTLTKSMNYKPVVAGYQSNGNAGTKENFDAGKAGKKIVPNQEFILLPLWTKDSQFSSSLKESPDAGFKPSREEEKKDVKCPGNEVYKVPRQYDQEKIDSTNTVSTASTNEVNAVGGKSSIILPDDLNMPNLEEIVYSDDDEDVGAEPDMTNLDSHIPVSPIPTTRIHKDHLVEQIIGDIHSAPQTRRMTKNVTNHDLPYSKRAIGTKWIYRNKKDERGIVVRNKTRLVAQGHTQEEGIDYDEVFAPVVRIEAIRLFLAYASFKDFIVYQMDVKSAFLYGKIEEEVYVYQPLGFEDPEFPDKVYKVEKALYGLHQALRAWYETLSIYLLDYGFQRGQIDKTLFIKNIKGDILLVQVYVDDIIFGSTKKELCTEFETLMHKKFQISSMGELTFFLGLQVTQKDNGIFIIQDKPDIMFVVCACARFQVTPKVLHLHAVKRIFRYLKCQLRLGLWYPKYSPFDLESYTDSDYAGASLNRKSTTRGCQFLGRRLILWQCKKQTIVANSTTEAEYVAASSCYRQVL